MGPVISYLKAFNPFFSRLSYIVILCMLKTNKLIVRPPKKTLCSPEYIASKFYLILSGKIKLINSSLNMRRVCETGESILE